ncbi:MAG: RdgB/HAM1 family non-canonical purine NTP pyrophosphatase [Candidatus Hydrogenedentota bacterium]|nr:MAG: RdgB/HAM1 family non-canonical purine NTP pyrophosphatase [Candidatus Hydrogenedentota bacterium]
MEIYLATESKGKLKEYQAAFKSNKNVILKTLSDLPQKIKDAYNPAEVGHTFLENAFIKARALYSLVQKPVIGEDAGLCVNALDGRPGIYSARYASTDESRVNKLLRELRDQKDRRAYFISVLCYLEKPQMPVYFIGKVFGFISNKPRGTSGFGYDPIFIPEGHEKTFAELMTEQKENLSHRGKAIHLLTRFLQQRSHA